MRRRRDDDNYTYETDSVVYGWDEGDGYGDGTDGYRGNGASAGATYIYFDDQD